MKTYLTLKSIPELSGLPKSERGRFWRRHAHKAFRHRITWVGFFIYFVVSLIGYLISLLIYPWVPWGYIFTGVVCAFGIWIFLQFLIPVVRNYLREDSELNKLLGK